MNVELVEKNLLETKEILDNLEVSFWLNWGTLLGAVRDNKLIAWDKDVDIIILAKDWRSSMLDEFRAKGFGPCNEWKWYPGKVSAFRAKKRGIEVNTILEYYYRPDDVYVALNRSPAYPYTVIPAIFLRNNSHVVFLEKEFRVPSPVEKYLEQIYGKSWAIPIKDWNWTKARKAISLKKYLDWFDSHPKKEWLK